MGFNHMTNYGYGMPAGFGIMTIIMFIIWLVFLGLSLYIMILVIKALKKYIEKD